MLIILRGKQVLEAKKFDYTRNPESRKFRPMQETESPSASAVTRQLDPAVEVEKQPVSPKQKPAEHPTGDDAVSGLGMEYIPSRKGATIVEKPQLPRPFVLSSCGKSKPYYDRKEMEKEQSARTQQIAKERHVPRPNL
jgi:hypothetical protein